MKSTHPVPTLFAMAAAVLVLHAPDARAATIDPPADLSGWACTGECGATAASGDIGLSMFGSPRYGYVATAGSTVYGVSPLVLSDNSRGIETNGSRLVSGSFAAAAGDQLAMAFNYVSTDGKGFDDYAWARVVDAGNGSLVAWLFTARSSNSNTKGIVPGDVVSKDEFDPAERLVGYKDWDFVSKDAADPVDWSPLGGSNRSCWEDNAAGCGYTGWLESRYAFTAGGSYRIEVGVVNWGDEAFDSGLAFDYAHLSAPVPEPATWALMLTAFGAFGAFRRSGRGDRAAPGRAGG